MANKKKASAANKSLAGSSAQIAPNSFPIVGIGASAGGLTAFEAFFSGMPTDNEPGMAFVLVQHLSPDHKSILSELIRRYTRMQVFEVEDGMRVQINCAYIIPPNFDMAFLNGSLHLLEPAAPRGQRLPIDYFFQTLADDLHELSIGIVLSGTGSDGSAGVRAIKNAGGMVMAQSIATCEFDGMPRSAIATGLMDYQLDPAEMAGQLMAYASHAYGKLARSVDSTRQNSENELQKISIILRTKTGHDFSQYKPSTINRRIERRMAVHQIKSLDSYINFLRQTPAEIEALFRDLLIGVTSFFRDSEAFLLLEQEVIPALFEGKSAGSAIRVWSAGCSTGEEAYTLAILLLERIESLKQSFTMQLFATDIDSQAIAIARTGLYPASISADISAERLARFFTLEPGGLFYRVNKSLRDLLVFSEQNIIQDPPFSRLDLISCRNLLIYLNVNLQKHLIPLFHYSLLPGGKLFLGSSEGIGEFDHLFSVLNRKAKVFQRQEDLLGTRRNRLSPLTYEKTVLETVQSDPAGLQKSLLSPKLMLRDVMEQTLLKQIAPASALVNASGDIVYLHGRTGMYLEPAAGESGIQNMIKMARQGLRPALSNALHQVVSTKQPSHAPHLQIKTNGDFTLVDLSVHPVSTAANDVAQAPLYLVMLQEVPVSAELPLKTEKAGKNSGNIKLSDARTRIETLLQELRTKDEYLQTTHEELESSNEELKSSNEEMQSINEELQSTNEELETSKEELQSVNEELATVNNELQTKVTDLSNANNDMNNLLAGTGVGTLFVDMQLRILRFTPAVSGMINVITTDIGRPVSHIASNLMNYSMLVEDLKEVLKTLVPVEREVQTEKGHWYTLRIQPYRTLDNVIEGAVITFVDITEIVVTRETLREANNQQHLAVVVRDSRDAITVQDLQGHIISWNEAAVRLYGWSEEQALKMNITQRIPENLRKDALKILQRLSDDEVIQPYLTQRLTQAGEKLDVSIISTALLDKSGQIYAIATTERAKTGGLA